MWNNSDKILVLEYFVIFSVTVIVIDVVFIDNLIIININIIV